MSIPADPESIEQIRERLRKMSDLELRQSTRCTAMTLPTHCRFRKQPFLSLLSPRQNPSRDTRKYFHSYLLVCIGAGLSVLFIEVGSQFKEGPTKWNRIV